MHGCVKVCNQFQYARIPHSYGGGDGGGERELAMMKFFN